MQPRTVFAADHPHAFLPGAAFGLSLGRSSPGRTGATLLLACLLLGLGVPATSWQQVEAQALPGDPGIVEVDGIRIHYVDQGVGEPVIFVHGTLQDYSVWLNHMVAFREEYRAISYSRRHSWPNDNLPPLPGYSAATDAEDLARLIEALELGPVHLVGFSYGGLTSLILATHRPELVRSLILAEPPLDPQPFGLRPAPAMLERPRFADLARSGEVREAMEGFLSLFLGSETMQAIPEPMWEHLMLNSREFVGWVSSSDPFPALTPQDLERLRMPTLLIVGANSAGTAFEAMSNAVADHVRGAEAVTIPGAGHMMWAENPEHTHQAVLDFLRRHAIGSDAVRR